MHDEIRIIDTPLRDGNTSLWAHNMTTGMMHPVLRHMDRAGFDGMEFFVSGRFKKVVREQRDNPWDWVRYGQKEIKNTQLRYHAHFGAGFGALLFEDLSDDWIFVFVFDLPTAVGQRHVGLNLARLKFVFTAEDLQRQVARRSRA